MKSGRRAQNSGNVTSINAGMGGQAVHLGSVDGASMTSAMANNGNSNNGMSSSSTQHGLGGVPDCAGCQKPIRERYLLRALDQLWHEDCLKCACCDCRLGEVGSTLFTKANLILCKRDYLRLFGATGLCSACHKSIPAFEMVMRARGNVYHLECFACQQCNHRFCVGDRFYLYENRILCEYDYEERMVFSQMGAYGGLPGQGPPMQPPQPGGPMQSSAHSVHGSSSYGNFMNGNLHPVSPHQVGPQHGHSGGSPLPLGSVGQSSLERSSMASPMQTSTNHNGVPTSCAGSPHKRQQQQQQMNGNIPQPQQSPVQAGTPGAPIQPEADILFDVGASPSTPNSLANSQTSTQGTGPNGGPK